MWFGVNTRPQLARLLTNSASEVITLTSASSSRLSVHRAINALVIRTSQPSPVCPKRVLLCSLRASVCVRLHVCEKQKGRQGTGGGGSVHLCVSICVWVAANALGALLGAQMVPRPATAELTMATFSHGTPSFLDPTPPVQA